MRKKKTTENLWSGLAEIGVKSIPAWWRTRCGTEGFAFLQQFLKPTTEIASWFPDPDDHTHHMDVGAHPVKDGKFLAKATAGGDAQELVLEKINVCLHRLDISAFGKAVAKALGLSILKMPHPVADNVIKLGAMPSHGLVLYLIVPSQESDFSTALAKIRLRDASALAIITPTRHSLPAEFRQLEDSGAIQHAALCDLLSYSALGFSATTSLSDYLSPVPGTPGGPPYAKWPHAFPAKPQWGHVEIVLQNIDRFWIKFGDSQGNFRYTDIQGFASGTDGKPTAQYNLLLLLAIKKGAIRVPVDEALQSRIRQTRNRLKRILCDFFEIKAKFHKDVGSKWQSLFHIRWEGPDSQRDKLVCHAGEGNGDQEAELSNWERMVSEAFTPTVNPDEKADFTA